MKKFAMFLTLISLVCWAQPDAPHRPIDPEPDVIREALPESLASGVNFYSFIPLQTARVRLVIENLAQFPNDILLVGDDGNGGKESRVFELREEGKLQLEEEDLEGFEHVYFMSLQPFHVQSDEPILVMGLKTRHFSTVTPTRRLEMVAVENAMGKRFMVGVTPTGDVHYPVYGFKLGVHDRESRTITRSDGRAFDVIER